MTTDSRDATEIAWRSAQAVTIEAARVVRRQTSPDDEAVHALLDAIEDERQAAHEHLQASMGSVIGPFMKTIMAEVNNPNRKTPPGGSGRRPH